MEKRCVTLTECVIIFVLIVALVLFVQFMGKPHEMGHPSSCSGNLRQIGSALCLYASKNRDYFPSVPRDISSVLIGTDINQGKKTNNGQSPWRNVLPDAEEKPYAKDSKGNFTAPVKTVTVSASLWLLCRDGHVTPKVFVCPGVKKKPNIDDPLMEKNGKTDLFPKYFSDFYTDPSAGALISYSFVSPYSSNWNTNMKPGFIIAADENDGSNPMIIFKDIKEEESKANSTNHKKEGQYVLSIDASVSWEKSPYAGINNDNIYTALPDNYTGLHKDTPGILSVRPRTKDDSVLIPVKESILTRWDHKP